ncbi:MAG: hypothetical protein AAF573_13645 [Bacteroidota bacterium]
MSQLFTYDELWKAIIEAYFEDFMLFFYQGDCSTIDFSRGCEFLEQEFRKFFPTEATKNRRADKVI